MNWAPFDVDDWAAVAEALEDSGKPWPVGAAVFDMRMDARTGKGGKPKGRPHYARRWCWTDWKVKQLFLDVARWADPTGFASKPTRKPPANRQRTASEPPAANRANANNLHETASRPPANRQPTASEPPHARKEKEKKKEKKTPAKRKPRKKKTADPRVKEATDLWADLHRSRYDEGYAWDFHKDNANLLACLLAAVEVVGEDAWLRRIHLAIDLYFDAVDAGSAFPKGAPPAVWAFRNNITEYISDKARSATTAQPSMADHQKRCQQKEAGNGHSESDHDVVLDARGERICSA